MALNAPVPPVGINTSVQPSELTQRRLQSMADVIMDDDDSQVESDRTTPALQDDTEVEDELSEQQLRELYDSEEIDRFLNIFSAVRLCFSRP
jgi:GRAM domain-containing protein 4